MMKRNMGNPGTVMLVRAIRHSGIPRTADNWSAQFAIGVVIALAGMGVFYLAYEIAL